MYSSPTMRIAFVSLHTSPMDTPGSGDAGGMNVVERHQALALAALGHQVDIFTRRKSLDVPDHVGIAPGVTVHHLTAGPPQVVAKSQHEMFIDDFRSGLAARAPYDLIVSQHWMSGMAGLPVARKWSVPHVQSYHSIAAPPGSPLSEGEPPESAGRVAGEAHLARCSDLILAISQYEADTVVNRCGADPARVAIVRPGVDAEMFRPLAEQEERWHWAGAQPEQLTNGYVLFAARLQPLKGPELAIESLAHVPKAIRPHLAIAGEASKDFHDYQRQLHQLIDSLGLTDDVTFIGSAAREQFATMLRSARAVLLPSHSETFGLVALEAAASGVPVIASAAGGLMEAISDGCSGYLMATRDPRRWGRQLTELLQDAADSERIGIAARRRALGFSWSAVGGQLATIFGDLVEAGPRQVA